MKKLYFVCRSYKYYPDRGTYVEASEDIDFLSCEAIAPIERIEAQNKKEAISIFRAHERERAGIYLQ